MLRRFSTEDVSRLIAAGRFDEAERLCRRALDEGETKIPVYLNLAHIAYQKRSIDDALALLDTILTLEPENSPALHNLGVISDQAGDLGAAEDYYRRAVAGDPDNLAPLRNLASLLMDRGEIDDARTCYASVIAKQPLDADAHFAYSRLARYGEDDATLPALYALAEKGSALSGEAQVKAAFTVGKANQDLGRYDDAFEAFRAGNALHFRQHPYPEARNHAMLADVRARINSALLAKFAGAGPADSMPIFVLGMPRSGSTLVEQMLAAHAEVATAGEVNYLKQAVQGHLIGDRQTFANAIPGWTAGTLSACAGDYLDRLRAHAAGRSRVVDKMPGNFAFIGLIAAMLPGAKIVHTVREPMATIWSNYSTHFRDALHYTYDLDVLTRYYGEYRKTMSHWQTVLPEGRVFELRYEELVTTPEETLRRLLGYLDLEWTPVCLDFHEARRQVRTASIAQVRQPLYTAAVDLWKNYRDRLAPYEAAVDPL
jgi:tetratricopeptide (TPR) repeat protein